MHSMDAAGHVSVHPALALQYKFTAMPVNRAGPNVTMTTTQTTAVLQGLQPETEVNICLHDNGTQLAWYRWTHNAIVSHRCRLTFVPRLYLLLYSTR